jgi:N-dimethylarginine dimethylaminohydrolase
MIHGEGRLEGGDVVWIGLKTLAVGLGYRSNAEGIRQLSEILGDTIDELLTVPLPHWRGPDDVFHLMSILSPLDHDLALVYSPLLPAVFRAELLASGFELVDVPDGEFETMACNVLAVAPRQCVALAGNPETRRRLEAAGVVVHEYGGDEISVKGAGGPTCLTRPLVRDPA